jgi:hypothetical protein
MLTIEHGGEKGRASLGKFIIISACVVFLLVALDVVLRWSTYLGKGISDAISRRKNKHSQLAEPASPIGTDHRSTCMRRLFWEEGQFGR